MVSVYDRERGRVKAYIDGICVWTENFLQKIRQDWRGPAFRFQLQAVVARIDACVVKASPGSDTVPHLRWLLIAAANARVKEDIDLWGSLITDLERLRDTVQELRPSPLPVEPDDPQEGPEYRADYRQEFSSWLSHHEKVERKMQNQVAALRALTDDL